MPRVIDGHVFETTQEFDEEIAQDQAVNAPRRRVSKELIRSRIAQKGKIAHAVQMMMADAELFSRWTLPGRVDVYADDPDTIAFLNALGVDPFDVMAPE